ncbi:putative ankyrin repeat protein RF_0381 [Saccostrea cucullata]|uniref:putative ankyrin repeat protein RF_0381 n=1 Tax=Saccostrea cuccullata TaxID=36930 RepID=UPI002ED61608
MVMVKNHQQEMEEVLVKTRAFDRAKELLEKNRHVVIIGVPGAGKTTLAMCLLMISMDEGKRPLQVFKMSELYGRVSPFDNLAIFIDNAFGESSFSLNDFNDFSNKKKVIESLVYPCNSGLGNILILTVRNDIYLEIAAKQKNSDLLLSSVIDLSTGEYALEYKELVMFLNKYKLPGNIKEDLKFRQTGLYLPLGFPQCCRLAHTNTDFGKDLSNFLRSPSCFLKDYFQTLMRERAVKMAVLIYFLFKGGSVQSSLFSVQKDREMKSIALKMLELDIKSTDGDTVLHYASRIGEFSISRYLVAKYPKLINVKNNQGYTVLHSGFVCGDRELVSFLIEKGLDINALTNEGESVLHIACRNGKYDACEFIVINYPKLIDVKDNDGYTALHSACVNGDRKLISFLIQKGLNISALTNDGESVLDIACLNGRYDACEFLITHFPQLIDVRNNSGYKALNSACVNGDRKLISFLIEKGSDVNSMTNSGESVLHITCLNGKYDACEFLASNYPHLIGLKDNKGYTALHFACVNGDKKLISFLITNGVEINAKTNEGESVLHVACRNGKYDACEFIVINYPKLIDVKDNDGYTALHSACVNGDRKLISFLIQKGLNIGALTNDGESVLHIACRKGKYDACEFLATGFSQLMDIKDNKGNTTLHFACINGNRRLISFLIEKGFAIDSLTNDGENIFHVACRKDSNGYTALHFACVYGDRQLISFLIEKGFDINAKTNDGESVFHVACRKAQGLDINAQSGDGENALHIACFYGNTDLCKFIVDINPQLLHAKEHSGSTVLHAAALSGNLELFQYLVNAGLDVHCMTEDGRCLFDKASNRHPRHPQVIRLAASRYPTGGW